MVLGLRRASLCLLLVGAACIACQPSVLRFALRPPLREDPDRNHVPRKPAKRFSGLYADAVDKTLFRPLAGLLAWPVSAEAVNVNALDEVPNSSWFENRVGTSPLSPAEAAAGSCRGAPPLDPARGPWRVIAGKDEGITPGFTIQTSDGQRYLVKVDGSFLPERASAADVVGSRIFHAAGYNAPCNTVVFAPRSVLQLAPGATVRDPRGRRRPLTPAVLSSILAKAVRRPDGRLRLMASRYLAGQPLGPYPVVGVRPDDPNDVIPHEDRRELRALRLVNAWLGRFDTREANSLDMWVEQEGRRFVRHYQLDFGDALGSPWTSERLSRRIGYAHYLDLGQVAVDLCSLGAVPRPWHHPEQTDPAGTFEYFGWRRFVPSAWKPVYPQPAFSRMTWRDALWITRIIVRFTDAHLRAIVAAARLSNPRAERYLLRALIERRQRIAREYLRRYNPLANVQLERGPASERICFEDLAIRHAGIEPRRVLYQLSLWAGARLSRRVGWRQLQPAAARPDRTCIAMPLSAPRPGALVPDDAPDDDPRRYAVLEIRVRQGSGREPTSLRVHLYDLGRARGFVIAGLERARAR